MNELSNVPVPVPESSSSSIGAIKGQIEVGGIGSLEVLDATDLSLVPDISIAANTAELDDVDNFLSMSGNAAFTEMMSDMLKPPTPRKPPLESQSSLDSLVSILQALPGNEDGPHNNHCLKPSLTKQPSVNKGLGKIWSQKPPINRAHSGFHFNMPTIPMPESAPVPGIPSNLKRIPKPPIEVKVDDKLAAAAQASFDAVANTGWVDTDPSSDSDDGSDRPAPIRLIAKKKETQAPHVQTPMPKSRAGILNRVKELQAKLLGPYTRLSEKTPVLPQINALDPILKNPNASQPMRARQVPQSMFNLLAYSEGGNAKASAPGVAGPAVPSASTLIKRRKTDAEDDLLAFDDLDSLIDENAAFGPLFGDSFVDDAPSSDAILGFDGPTYNDLLTSFDGVAS